MNAFVPLLLLAAGILLLTRGAGWLVDGASSLAKRAGIAPIVIGLTVVAFGTSAPELVVNLVSAFRGHPDIAFGNVIGSNIANVLLILGIAAAVAPLAVKRSTVRNEIPLAALAALLVWFMASDRLLAGRSPDVIDRIDGLVLLSYFIIFLYYTFGISKVDAPKPEIEDRSARLSWLYAAAGLLALGIGGKFAVDGASAIARLFGVTEALIGLTVVAVGTSLPELAASVVAARRGHPDIAFGNVIGSNIFNVFWILGLSAMISPLPVARQSAMDALVAALVMVLLFLSLYVGRRRILERWQGAILVAVYIAFMSIRFTLG